MAWIPFLGQVPSANDPQGLAIRTDMPHAIAPGAEQVAVSAALLLLTLILMVSLWMWRSRVRRATAITVNVLLVVGFFLALEGVLQLHAARAFDGHRPLYVADPVLGWHAVAADSDGPLLFLGYSYDAIPPKRAGEVRVVCLGDSSTMGVQGDARTAFSYPSELQTVLRTRYPGRDITVINLGVSGYSSYQGRLLLEHVGVRYQPDLVTVAFAFHDANTDVAEDKTRIGVPDEAVEARSWLYRSRLYMLLRKQLVAAPPVVTAGVPVTRVKPDDYVKNLEDIVRVAREAGSAVLLINMPLNMAVLGQAPGRPQYCTYHDLDTRVGQTLGVAVLDACPSWTARDVALFEPANPNHLVQAGCARLAREIADVIASAKLLPQLGP